MRVTLAAGTATGAGTAVALPAAIAGLVLTGADVVAVVPVGSAIPAADPHLTVTTTGRLAALLREAVGVRRDAVATTDIYIGFCDRLPLLRRGGSTQVLVVQNPHLYATTGVATTWSSRAKFAGLRWWAHRSARRADRVICSTSTSRAEVATATGLDPGVIEVIPIPATGISIGGVTVTKTDHRDRIERVLLVGDLYPYKRTETAIRAVGLLAADHPERPVTLIHIGSDRDPVARRAVDAAVTAAQGAGVDVVRLGPVTHDRVIQEMVDADVIVLASTTETQGLPLVEAMAVGLPVVARAIGPFAELGDDAFRSVEVNAGEEEFAAAIASIDGRAERVQLAERGRSLHPPGHSWDLLRST